MRTNKNQELFEFLAQSPTAFHAVANIAARLRAAGFTPLAEQESWTLIPGGQYFVTRNGSSILAFRIPADAFSGFQIVASHSDSPAFKLKQTAEIEVDQQYTKLNVEGYGGMLQAPWFDRPLSVAGRVLVGNGQGIETKLVNIDRDLVLIPSLAIHLNRKVNEGYAYNLQKDLLPVVGDGRAGGQLAELVAESAGVTPEAVVGQDLFLYNRDEGSVWGVDEEYISAPRIDNLECAFGSLEGFLAAEQPKNVAVYGVFDNEEVGSSTKQGAGSTFLKDVLKRLSLAFGSGPEDYYRFLAGSFMVSADNAHAVHPNVPEKSDPTNKVYMNEGIVIKHSANQKYTTDGVSRGIFQAICRAADVPIQDFVNRSDVSGGSTLGNISNTQASMNTVDIGLAQLAMHSPYETAGSRDLPSLITAVTAYYQTKIECLGNGAYNLK